MMTFGAEPPRTRALLLARSALTGALAGWFGLLALQAHAGPSLPVQAPSMPQVAGGNAVQPQITVSGATMTVNANAARTLIDWNSFTVAQGSAVNFTLNARGDIVLNRLVDSTPVMINGVLTSTVGGVTGGNIWFSAPGGVIFGSTAVVNVGGLLATTALVDVSSFLNPANASSFPFTYPGTGYPGTTGDSGGTYFPGVVSYPPGSAYPAITGAPVSNVAGGVGGVTVQSGASLTANGGMLALIAPFVNVATGATITSADHTANGGGAGSVLYGSANAFTLSLTQETSGDLDMLQFVINQPSQVTDTPLLLHGSTTGTNVYLAALTASGITGAVVDATGTLTATTASTGAGGEIILSTGADTITAGQVPTFTTQSISPLQLNLGDVTAGGPLSVVSSGGINATAMAGGVLQSGGDMNLAAGGDIVLGAAQAGGAFNALAVGYIGTSASGFPVLVYGPPPVGPPPVGGFPPGPEFGLGAISAMTITAGGAVDLEGASVGVGAVTAGLANGATGAITANAYDTQSGANAGNASVDIGSATAPGAITLTANDGYASLTNVAFMGSGASLTLNAYGFSGVTGTYEPAYFGYGSGGPTANGGAGPTAGVGAVTGTGTINLASNGDVDLNVAGGSGLVTVGTVNASQTANLTADALTITGIVQGYAGANATARTGDLNATEIDATNGDVNAAATLGSVYLASTTANNVYVTAGNIAHVDAATTRAAYVDPINVTGATAYLGTGNSQDAINVTATNGSATAGDLTALGAITVSATNGAASLHSASAGTSAFVPVAMTVSVSASGPGGNVVIGGTDSSGTLGYVVGAGSVTAQASQDVTVNVAQPIELNSVTAGGNLSLTAPTLILDSLQGALTGAIGIDVTQAGFTYANPLTAGAGLSVTASGALSLGPLTAQGGDINLTAGGAIALTTAQASGAFNATATTTPNSVTYGLGAISATSITAGGAVDLEGASVSVGAVTAGTANGATGAITANAYDRQAPVSGSAFIDIGSVTAPGVITLTANDGYASVTNVAFTGSGASLNINALGYNPDGVTPAPVYVGYGAGGPTANGGAGPTAAVGVVTGTGTINLTSNGDVDLNVAGGTGLVNVATVTAGRNLNLTAPTLTLGSVQTAPTGNITVDVTQGGFTYGTTLVAGPRGFSIPPPLTAGGSLSVTAAGAITLGPVVAQGGGITLAAGGPLSLTTAQSTGSFAATAKTVQNGVTYGAGSITATTLTAGGSATLTGSSVKVGTITAGTANGASGAVTATALDTQSGANAGAAFVDVGSITAPGTITLSGDGYASLTNVAFTGSGQSLNISADVTTSATPATLPVYFGYGSGGPSANNGAGPTAGVGKVTGVGTINLSSKGDVDLNVAGGSGLVSLGTVTAGRNLNLSAPTLVLGSLQGVPTGSIAINVTQGSFSDTAALTAGGSVSVAASGALNLGPVAAQGGGIALAAGGPLSLTTAQSSGSFAAAATTVQNGVTYGLGSITATTIMAGGSASLTGSSVKVGTLTAGTANGATGAVTATALDTPTGSNAGAAFVDIGSITAPGTITLSGDGYASLTNVTFTGSGQSLNIKADVTTSATPPTLAAYFGYGPGGPSANAGAGPTAGVGQVTGTGTINLKSKGDVDLNVAAGSGLVTLGTVSAGRNLNLTAPTLVLGSLQTVPAGNIAVTVTQGSFSDAAALTAGGGLSVTAAGAVNLGPLTAQGGAITLTSGGPLSLTTAQASGSVTATATTVQNGVTYGLGAITATTLTAGGAATLTGSSVKVGTLTAGGAVTATGLDTPTGSNAGAAFVDIGSITAPGTITLSGDGYASLTNVAFTGSGQSLTLSADVTTSATPATLPVYFGYASGGPSANNGAGPTAGVGQVTGTGTINLASKGDVDLNVASGSGQVTLGTVSAAGNLNLTAPTLVLGSLQTAPAGNIAVTVTQGGFTDANPLTAGGSLSVTAAGALALNAVTAQGGAITLTSGGPLSLTTAQSGGSFTAAATTVQNGVTYGLGSITATTIMAGGSATLTGSSVKVGAITAGTANGATGAVTATALDTQSGSNAGNAFVDIGSITAPGTITLSGDGYASLTNVAFTGPGQSLTLSADVTNSATPATLPVYFGYASGGPSANNGAGPTAGVGSVTGTGTINLNSKGDVDLNVASGSGQVTLGTVSAAGNLNLTAPTLVLGSLQTAPAGNIAVTVTQGAFSDTAALTAGGGLSVTAAGAVNLGPLTARGGAITLTSGGPLSLTTAQASGSVTATATTVQNGVTYGLGAITATTVTAGGSTTLTGSSVKVGTLTAGGAVTATALDTQSGSNAGNAFVDVGSITAPGTITLSGDGYASLTNVAFTGSGQSLTLSADVTNSATPANLPVYFGYASGGPSANNGAGPTAGVGSVTGTGTINLASKGDVDLNVAAGSGQVTLGTVSAAGNLNLTAPTLVLGSLQTAPAGNIAVNVTQGGFTDANPLTAGGSLSVTAAGALALSAVTAQGGAITLTSGGPLSLTTAQSSGSFTAAATTVQNGVTYGLGSITGTTIMAGGSATLTGSSVKVGAITAGGAVTATGLDTPTGSNAGAAFVDVGSITAPGTITLSGDGYASLTNVAFTGSGQSLNISADVTTSATPATLPVYFGYGSGGPSANNGAGPTAGVGEVTGTGTINLASKGDVDLNVAAGSGLVTLATVSAGQTANLVADGLTLSGAVQGASGVNATARTGALSATSLVSASGDVNAQAPLGAASVSSATGADVYVSGASAQLQTAASQGAVGVTATNGSATAGDLTALGAITVSATHGAASLHAATAGTSTSTAGAMTVLVSASGPGGNVLIGGLNVSGALGGVVGAGSVTAQAQQDVTVNVAQPIELNLVKAGGNLTLTAPNLSLDALQSAPAGNIAVNVTQGGFTDANPLTAGGSLSVTAAGALALNAVTAQGGAITLTSGGPLSLTTAQSSGSFTAAATTVQNGVTYGLGSITATTIMAGGSATLTGSSVKVGAITAGTANGATGAVTATALDTQSGSNAGNAFVDIGSITAPGTITLSGDGYASLTNVAFTGPGQSLTLSADVTNSATPATLPVYFGYASGGPSANNGAGPTAGVGSVTGTGTINLNSKGDVDLNVASGSGQVTLGTVSAAGNLNLTAPTLVLGSLQTAPAGNIAVTVTQGAFSDTAALTAGGGLSVAASGALNLGPVVAQGGAINLTAGGAIGLTSAQASGALSIATNGGSVSLSSAQAGGPVNLVASGALTVGPVTSGAGAVSLTGASITTGALASQGPITANAVSGGATFASILAPSAVTLTGVGVSLGSGLLGGDLTIASGADASLGSLTVGGALALDAVGQASINSVSVAGTGRVTAGTLNVATSLSAPTLTIESVSGALTVGGSTAPTSGMWISPATFAALQASTSLNLYAGSATGTARGALVLSDLSLNPASTPNVAFYAGSGQTVSVTGTVAPTGNGVNLSIGSATTPAWTPSSILISGSLGASTRVTDTTFTNVQALRQVTLVSSSDVLIGSPSFISLIQMTSASSINIGNNQPSGLANVVVDVGKVYVTAGELVISASGKVVQQNTSGTSVSASGLYLLNGVNSNNIALSIDPPVVVDLFGTIVNASGVPIDQISANQGSGVQLATPTAGQVPTDYRFGGCEFFTGCGTVQTAEAAVVAQPLGPVAQQSDSSSDSSSDSGSGSGSSGGASASPSARPAPVAIAAPPSATEEEIDPLVTGVGNEEIWRKRRAAKEKDQ